MRTITDRRRFRSMPTYSRCCSTGVSFRRLRVGLQTPSVLGTLGSRRREELRRFGFDTAEVATDPRFDRRPGSHHRNPSRGSGAALLHDISPEAPSMSTEPALSGVGRPAWPALHNRCCSDVGTTLIVPTS
jgi:hypothetical protein